MASIDIPERCGAILLPGATLFPQGVMPLHIFEPRYREMLDDALQGDCMICVGTLLENETDDPSECVAATGTIGLIRASREQEDGRSNLILHGILRVDFKRWRDEKAYPFAEIEPTPSFPIPDTDEKSTLAELRAAVHLALKNFPEGVVDQMNKALDQVEASPVAFADVIAQQFILDPAMRRGLLEEQDVKKRYEALIHELQNAEREDRN